MAKLSLQEQMLQAGLVNKKKLKKAKKGSKKSRDLAKEVKANVEATKQAQVEKAKALNEKHQSHAKAKEIRAQIKQLIEVNKQATGNGEIKYNFTHGSLIKHLYVNEQQRKQLLDGHLAVVTDTTVNNAEESYCIIPTMVANKIAQRDETYIVDIKEPEDPEVVEDDPYADYVVPDDLMW